MRNRIVRALARLRGLLEGGRRWALVLTLVAGVLAFGRVNRFSVAPVELRSEPPRAGAQPAQDERFDPRSAAYGLVAGQAAQRIAHAAELAVATREFARSRASL